MRDKLEGTRPDDMSGVNLRKEHPTRTDAGITVQEARPKRIHYVLGWILAAVMMALLIWNLIDRKKTVSDHRAAVETRQTPEYTYVSSAFEPVVIADFKPSEQNGDEEYAARVRLLGKDGMEMERDLPLSCADAPIQARLLRAIRIRTDTWQLRGGGEERLISEDDAEAALCGDFTGRDVPRIADGVGRRRNSPH